jgi:hypothetical protein
MVSPDLQLLWNELESGLRQILDELRETLTSFEREEVLEYIDHNEFGCAHHHLLFVIKNNQLILSRDQSDRLRSMAVKMGLDSDLG